MASYYVFNIQHPTKLVKTLRLCDKAILGVQFEQNNSTQQKAVEKRVVSFLSTLNSRKCEKPKLQNVCQGKKRPNPT